MILLCVTCALIAVLLVTIGLVTLTFNKTVQGSPGTFINTATVTGENAVQANPDVLIAVTGGTLTTRTTGTAGTLTMLGGHGIVTGQRVDLYWAGGQCYGAVVGTVSGLSVPIASVAGGDALPIATTAIDVGICNQVAFNVVGDNMVALVETAGPDSGYVVIESSGAVLLANYLSFGNSYSWRAADGTNPLAGVTATKLFMSQRGLISTITTMHAYAVTN